MAKIRERKEEKEHPNRQKILKFLKITLLQMNFNNEKNHRAQAHTLTQEKLGNLFLCPRHFVYQFWTISNKTVLREKLEQKFQLLLWYLKMGNLCLRIPPEAPFYWKLLRNGIQSAKDIRKCGLIFQHWVSKSASPTLPVFREVLY